MELIVKEASVGKVQLEDGVCRATLDENTPQEVLAHFYESEVGRQHIEQKKSPDLNE